MKLLNWLKGLKIYYNSKFDWWIQFFNNEGWIVEELKKSINTANNQAEPTKAIVEWNLMELNGMEQCWRLNEAWFAVGYGR